jgi:hypothetical protein
MKLNYQIKTLTPLFTGSDETAGTVRKLRREKRLIEYPVYNSIKPELKTGSYGFYDAYANKVKAAAGTRNKKQFINRLLESCGIITLPDGHAQLVRESLDKFNNDEFLNCIREENQYLMILLREYVAYFKSNKAKDINSKPDFFKKEIIEDSIESIDYKFFENVPYIGGNSIRGLLRRLVMRDFVKQIGIIKLKKEMYHQLFTGGNITQSTDFEDIENRESYINNCPMLGLLGSAIGNMTIEGELKVIGARLECIENGTGDVSFWELIEENFGTRRDDSKTESEIEITGEMTETTQMLYQYECFITGCLFNSSFYITTDNELLISAFWRMMELYKEFGFIGGNSARDSGMVDVMIEIPENASKLYLEYLKENKIKIKSYFQS